MAEQATVAAQDEVLTGLGVREYYAPYSELTEEPSGIFDDSHDESFE